MSSKSSVPSTEARIVSLQLCPGNRAPMTPRESITAIEGFGLEGDRHAASEGLRKARQVLLMDEETLNYFGLSPAQIRENITTTGIDLASLATGQKVALGDEVVMRITGDCEPCDFIENIRPGLREQMEGRRGMLAYVVKGGAISVGDAVRVVEGVEVA